MCLGLLGWKRASCASRNFFLSAFVILFATRVAGGRKYFSQAVAAALFHSTATAAAFGAAPYLFVHIDFHVALFAASFISCWKEVVGGASRRRFDMMPLSYWTRTACFTRRSSPMRRMCPSHSNLRLRITISTLKVRAGFLMGRFVRYSRY